MEGGEKAVQRVRLCQGLREQPSLACDVTSCKRGTRALSLRDQKNFPA